MTGQANNREGELIWSMSVEGTASFAGFPGLSLDFVVVGHEAEQIFFHRRQEDMASRSRARYSAVLPEISVLFNKYGFLGVAGELTGLAVALDDLNLGIVQHYLRPTAVENRPLDSFATWMMRLQVAHGIDLLRGKFGSIRSVCKYVVGKYPLIELSLASGSEKPELTYAKWHSAFINGRVKHYGIVQAWNNRQDLTNLAAAGLRAASEVDSPENVGNRILRDAGPLAARNLDGDELKKLRAAVARKRGTVRK